MGTTTDQNHKPYMKPSKIIIREIRPNEFCWAHMLAQKPQRKLADLCRVLGIPVAKYKKDAVARLSNHFAESATPATITIG